MAWKAWQRNSLVAIAGPAEDDGFLPRLKTMAQQLNLGQSVRFVGPLVRGCEMAGLSRRRCFVLPSQNENFGNTAAESAACGTPVISQTNAASRHSSATQASWYPTIRALLSTPSGKSSRTLLFTGAAKKVAPKWRARFLGTLLSARTSSSWSDVWRARDPNKSEQHQRFVSRGRKEADEFGVIVQAFQVRVLMNPVLVGIARFL